MKNTWDLRLLYSGDSDPKIKRDIEEKFSKFKTFANKWKKDNSYIKDPAQLTKLLNELESISSGNTYLDKPYLYIFLRSSQDQSNEEIKKLYSLVFDKEVELINELNFINHNICKKIKRPKQKEFLEYSGLKQYRHVLESSFVNGKYLLSEKEEKLINLLSKSSLQNWEKMNDEFVSKLSVKKRNKEYTFEDLLNLTTSIDRQERKWAGDTISKLLQGIVDTSEYELNSILHTYKVINQLKKFKSADQERHVSDDIDTETVRSMVNAVTARFDISQRYYKLYKQVLNQGEISYQDKNISIFDSTEKFDIDKSYEITQRVFSKLDSEFGEIIKNMYINGQYDVFPYKGKRGGAFCITAGKELPIFILLNHDNKLGSLRTFAHESGHAVHGYLSTKNQSTLQNGHSTATAEVASTFFEDFTLKEVFKDADKQTKFNLIMKKLQDDVSTIFRQVACYNFELDLHESIIEKGFLSKNEIGNLFEKHMKAYLGESITFTEDHKNWWVYWSHIRSPFYVYSYASGLLISKALQKLVSENPTNIDKVKTFLSAGTSKSPKDIFLDAGLDITKKEFWMNGLKEIEDLLAQAESLAYDLKKI